MSKLFSNDYDNYDVGKCRRNLNFEKMDTAPYTEKNNGFDYCEEYLKSASNEILITAVLRKANADSVVIRRLIKNQ